MELIEDDTKEIVKGKPKDEAQTGTMDGDGGEAAKKSKSKMLKTRLQLFNPAHSIHLLKLFEGAQKFSLSCDLGEFNASTKSDDDDSTESEDETNIKDDTSEHRNHVPRKLRASPMTFYQNAQGDILALFRTALFVQNRKAEADQPEPAVDFTKIIKSPAKWGVVMISGGHFAAAVFQGEKAIRHKTIHKYTVRASQGGAQSARDNKSGSGGHVTAGGNLRRQNEATLVSNVHELLESWKSDFDACQWIFYRVGKASQQILFGGKTPIFDKTSSKIKTIPFQTKRPTFSEVKKVMHQLTTVQVYTKDEFLVQFAEPSPEVSPKRKKAVAQIDRARSRSPKVREDPGKPESSDSEEGDASDSEVDCDLVAIDTSIDLTELQEFGDSLTLEDRLNRGRRISPKKEKKKPKPVEPQQEITPYGVVAKILSAILAKDQLRISEIIIKLNQESHLVKAVPQLEKPASTSEFNQIVDKQKSTILHIAVSNDFLDLVWALLECGADPTFKDKQGRYAYNCATTKECRLLFRKFRGKYPDKYDYHKAQVPDPITEENEQELAEKKRLQNKLKREKEKQKKQEKKEKQEELAEKERFLNMTDREKRAFAAEQRIIGEAERAGEVKPVLLRCFDCGLDMTGKVPFEYNKNQFCSSKCLTTHRKKFPVPLSY